MVEKICSINSLPTDILLQFFGYFTPDYELMLSYGAYFEPRADILAAICRHWRILALATPSLWTRIRIKSTRASVERAQCYAERSQGCALWVVKDGHHYGSGQASDESAAAELLRSLFPRCVALGSEICTPIRPVDGASQVGLLQLLETPSPALTRLTLWCGPGNCSLNLTGQSLSRNFPCLKTLHLSNLSLDLSGWKGPCLRSLRIKYHYWSLDSSITVRGLNSMIASSPKLTELDLEIHRPTVYPFNCVDVDQLSRIPFTRMRMINTPMRWTPDVHRFSHLVDCKFSFKGNPALKGKDIFVLLRSFVVLEVLEISELNAAPDSRTLILATEQPISMPSLKNLAMLVVHAQSQIAILDSLHTPNLLELTLQGLINDPHMIRAPTRTWEFPHLKKLAATGLHCLSFRPSSLLTGVLDNTPSLRHLTISGQWGDELFDGCPHLEQLETLAFITSDNITDEGLEDWLRDGREVSNALRALRVVVVRACAKIREPDRWSQYVGSVVHRI